jgi:hypothetical protein
MYKTLRETVAKSVELQHKVEYSRILIKTQEARNEELIVSLQEHKTSLIDHDQVIQRATEDMRI